MRERQILMSAPMVMAILAGCKTQTRRIVKPQPEHFSPPGVPRRTIAPGVHPYIACPYGQPGERLWVRENGWERPYRTAKMMRDGADTWPKYAYDADGWTEQDHADFKAWGFKRRPSIHMPRWASRITLEITAVRVERLQDISEEDAMSEGITCENVIVGAHYANGHVEERADRFFFDGCDDEGFEDAVDAYAALWDSINGAGSWDANPFVWVVSFKRVDQ